MPCGANCGDFKPRTPTRTRLPIDADVNDDGLGAGGLVRTVAGRAAQCLRSAEHHRLVATCALRLSYGFEDSGTVHPSPSAYAGEKLDEYFDADGARLHVRVLLDRVDSLKFHLRDATRDRIRLSDATDPDRSQR